jgi:hypothetical protein
VVDAQDPKAKAVRYPLIPQEGRILYRISAVPDAPACVMGGRTLGQQFGADVTRE